MLVLRLKPIGKKKQISFRLVVAEKRSKLDGRFIEDLGFYNPKTDQFNFKAERVKERIKQGAQLSDTVYNLLVTSGIINGAKRPVKIKKSKTESASELKQEGALKVKAEAASEAKEEVAPEVSAA
ncbi:MAG: 30S ribosomal protein S16 [bacterium]|nr:30S ribosomal protein S16 [bacterium]